MITEGFRSLRCLEQPNMNKSEREGSVLIYVVVFLGIAGIITAAAMRRVSATSELLGDLDARAMAREKAAAGLEYARGSTDRNALKDSSEVVELEGEGWEVECWSAGEDDQFLVRSTGSHGAAEVSIERTLPFSPDGDQ